jgi:hypothetical protein
MSDEQPIASLQAKDVEEFKQSRLFQVLSLFLCVHR